MKDTDSQALLEDYARTGSDSAFRELVTRYLGLVYSTALRLVGGDTHLAEDVAQMVFADLARKASGLSNRVMLGGWLHQRTYNVAAPMMRSRRRRQSREREAAQLNALQNDSASVKTICQSGWIRESGAGTQTQESVSIASGMRKMKEFNQSGLARSDDKRRIRIRDSDSPIGSQRQANV